MAEKGTIEFEFLWSGKMEVFFCRIPQSEYRKEYKRKVPDEILNIGRLFN